ncbi:copper resistance CopC family protein [Candidatus Leptofilum sp.]|uniref:copper resistance CopC family protein n=1 Tax=Candidatus Leptofilum sp. TaxID=3241576 RepID=UPI003B5B8560
MRRFWQIGLILLGTAVFIPTIFAHAELISAVPAPGSTVATLTELRLTFSESIGPNGQIQLHQNFISAAELAPVVENEVELVTAVPPLPDGAYMVQWSVISADGHPINGSYSLGISSSLDGPTAPWYFSGWAIGSLILLLLGPIALFLTRRKQA